MTKNALISVLSVLASGCLAQVTVEVVFDQEQFLRNESLPVRVRIANYSGQTLRLGAEPDWLSFVVEGARREPLGQIAPLPSSDPVNLENTKVANARLDLMPYYDVGQAGTYRLTAMVRIPELNGRVSSTPQMFQIVSGTTLWEKEFGVPLANPPQMRKFALQQATFLKQLRLYVRLSTPDDTKVFKVVSLGGMVSFARPETQMDTLSHLHVLFQNGARSFFYGVITPEGDLITRQTHEYTETRPRLRRNAADHIVVAGGQRLYYASDIPPSEPVSLMPVSTNTLSTNVPLMSPVWTNPPAAPNPPPTEANPPAHDSPPTNPATPAYLTPKIKRAD